ncbi:hypothetical protein ACU5AX_02130 [Sphingomonas sp. XXL09]|uniref:hypothetical protein n=1 Tax=Sphingomonas sp. XXL09 TaxID=3457787 RepID=UPI00406BA8EE
MIRRILFGNHATQMPAIAQYLDHQRYEASFAPFDAVDLTRFDLVVPLRVEQIASARPAAALGRATLPDADLVALCDDKLAFNRWLIGNGFGDAVPELLGPSPDVFPYIRKTRQGDFGFGCQMIQGPGEDDGADTPDVFRQRAIVGADEYVLHLLRVGGRVRFQVAYRYDMGQPLGVRGHADRPSAIMPTDPGPVLDRCIAILDALGFEGTCCFNYKLEEGALRILELNPRFGGSLVGVVTDYVAAHLAAL